MAGDTASKCGPLGSPNWLLKDDAEVNRDAVSAPHGGSLGGAGSLGIMLVLAELPQIPDNSGASTREIVQRASCLGENI